MDRPLFLRHLTAAGMAAAAPLFGSAVSAQTLDRVRLATLPIDVAAQAFYAADRGFFKAAGLDVDVVLMNNGPAIAAAVSSGDINIGLSNLVTLANAFQRGLPFVLVAPAGAYANKAAIDALLVPNGSPIKTARDLNGKSVGVNALKNIDAIALMAWMDQNGADSSSLKFIELPFAEMQPALAAGRIDAACLDEPFLGAALAGGTLHSIGFPYEAIGKRFLEGAWFTTKTYAQAHGDVVRRLADAFAASAVWANAHPAESAKIFAAATKRKLTAGTARTFLPPRFERADVQPLVDAAVKYGAITKGVSVAEMLAPGITFAK